MFNDLCGVRRLGMAAAAAISVVGSIVLVHALITPGSVQVLRTPELVAVLALFVLPGLTLAATLRAGDGRPRQPAQPGHHPRRSQHDPADPAERAERHRRRASGSTRV